MTSSRLKSISQAVIAGDLDHWHPHVHALVSRGGWSAGGEWVLVAFVDERSAELLFRHRVIRLLQDDVVEVRYRRKRGHESSGLAES